MAEAALPSVCVEQTGNRSAFRPAVSCTLRATTSPNAEHPVSSAGASGWKNAAIVERRKSTETRGTDRRGPNRAIQLAQLSSRVPEHRAAARRLQAIKRDPGSDSTAGGVDSPFMREG